MTPSPESPDVLMLRDLVRKRRYAEAFELAEALSNQGIIEGHVMVGWLYEWGNGTKQDLDEAERHYLKGTGAGSPVAYFYLASLYRQKKDGRRMLECLEVAAEAPFAPALFELGRVYCFGLHVPIDKAKALCYCEQAAKEGHWFARRNMAHEMLSGRLGLRRVPRGLLEIARLAWVAVGLSRLPESDERLLRW